MKRPKMFCSIYGRFIVIFLGIWWLLHGATFGVIMRIMSDDGVYDLVKGNSQLVAKFHQVQQTTGFVFLVTVLVGSIIILLAVRGIVRPIKRISKASKEVANGNFEIQVPVKNYDEIGQLTTDFNKMVKELQTIESMRKDFVSNVSHEFKTPITSIKGFAKLMSEGKLKEEQLMEYSEIIVTESERLSLLSANLLKLSELEGKQIPNEMVTFSLSEQIRRTILLLEPAWDEKNIEFDLELDEIKMTAPEHLVQEIWINMIQNAIKFSNENGRISLGVKKEKVWIVVTIEDHGIGMNEEQISHIFERFYKADPSRTGQGNGLGLVIVKKIVEFCAGTIEVESEWGKGTRFIVKLPR